MLSTVHSTFHVPHIHHAFQLYTYLHASLSCAAGPSLTVYAAIEEPEAEQHLKSPRKVRAAAVETRSVKVQREHPPAQDGRGQPQSGPSVRRAPVDPTAPYRRAEEARYVRAVAWRRPEGHALSKAVRMCNPASAAGLPDDSRKPTTRGPRGRSRRAEAAEVRGGGGGCMRSRTTSTSPSLS